MQNIVVIQTDTRIVSVEGETIAVPSETVKILSVGTQGPSGVGVPVGGTTGQVLKKLSSTNYDTAWQADNAGAAWGGITGTLSAQTDLQAALDAKANKTPTVTTQSGTSYTLQASDNGTILRFTNASAITLTCPNSLSVGFNVGILQMGTGQVTASAGAGATVNNRQSFTKTAGQYATASLVVQDNSGGSAAKYILGGDCA